LPCIVESPAHVRLLSKGEKAKKKLEAARQQKLDREKRENTFKPTFVAKSPRHSHAPRESSSPYYDRFAQQLLESEAKKKLAKAREEEVLNRELTYTPVLSTKKKSSRYTPASPDKATQSSTVFERLTDATNEKRLKDEEQIKNQMEKDMTFHPQIDKKSKEMEVNVRAEYANIPLHERLIKDGVRRSSVLIEAKKKQDEKEVAECTFQPKLSQIPEALHGASAQSGRTPSPMRRSSYMLPTQTSQARVAPCGVSLAGASSPQPSPSASASASVSSPKPGASPNLRRSSYFQPTKASQAKVDTSSVTAAAAAAAARRGSPRTPAAPNCRVNTSVVKAKDTPAALTPASTTPPPAADVVLSQTLSHQPVMTEDDASNQASAAMDTPLNKASASREIDPKMDGELVASEVAKPFVPKKKQTSLSMSLFDEIMAEHIDIADPCDEGIQEQGSAIVCHERDTKDNESELVKHSSLSIDNISDDYSNSANKEKDSFVSSNFLNIEENCVDNESNLCDETNTDTDNFVSNEKNSFENDCNHNDKTVNDEDEDFKANKNNNQIEDDCSKLEVTCQENSNETENSVRSFACVIADHSELDHTSANQEPTICKDDSAKCNEDNADDNISVMRSENELGSEEQPISTASRNGSVYEGQLEDGCVQGIGKVVHSDNSKYEGEWRGGVRHGQGMLTAPNGDTYGELPWLLPLILSLILMLTMIHVVLCFYACECY
jgi:hypothetical protein